MTKPVGAYLGLDLGTHMGFARCDSRKMRPAVCETGAWNFTPTRFDSPARRYVAFKQMLRGHLVLGVDLVFYEKVMRHIGTAAAHAYGAFLLALHETCDDYDTPYIGLSVQEIKKFATGKGNASKGAMVEAATKWGFAPGSEDEADAIAILKCGMETKL